MSQEETDSSTSYSPAIKEDEEQPAHEGQTTTAKIDSRLSTVSKKYDRGGKGYLDSKELMARELDDGSGPNVDRVIQILETLKQEQKSNMTMKKTLIALVVFSILLSLANVGTAFAAAKLAKDTHLQGVVLVNDNGEIVQVAEKQYQFATIDEDGEDDLGQDDRNRNLQEPEYTTQGRQIKRLFKTDVLAMKGLFEAGTKSVQINHCGNNGGASTTLMSYDALAVEDFSNDGYSIDHHHLSSEYGQTIIISCRSDRNRCVVQGLHSCSETPCLPHCTTVYQFCDQNTQVCSPMGCGCIGTDTVTGSCMNCKM